MRFRKVSAPNVAVQIGSLLRLPTIMGMLMTGNIFRSFLRPTHCDVLLAATVISFKGRKKISAAVRC